MENIEHDGKGRAAGATYRVDAGAVAEAMLRHRGVRRLLGADRDNRFSRSDDARTREPGAPPTRPGSA